MKKKKIRTYVKDMYNWNTYINDRAIVEFQNNNNIPYDLKIHHYYLLAKLVDLHLKSDAKIKRKIINNVSYVYVANWLILDNLYLWRIDTRTLQSYILKLKENNFIIVDLTDKDNERYISINDDLLKLWTSSTNTGTNEGLTITNDIKELAERVGRYFSKTNENQLKEVYAFIKSLNDIEYFKEEFLHYANYKDYTGEKKHSFKNYSKEWNNYDWFNLLEGYKMTEFKNNFD